MMGYREYARHRGVTLKAVQVAIQAGRISVNSKKKIDQEQADKDWEANTEATRQNNVKSRKTFTKNEEVKGPSYQQSRAVREAYQARLAKLEYEEKIEKLVDAEQVKREAFEEGRRLRDSFMSMPQRVSAELIACENQFDAEQILIREITDILKTLANG